MPIHAPSSNLPEKPTSLVGQNAVVTGASSGIGRAIANALAAAGANVLVHARANRAALEETKHAIDSLERTATIAIHDLAEPSEQDTLVKTAWARNAVDIWINNAGADVLTGATAKAPFEKKLDLLWRVDVCGTIRISRAVGRLMSERGRGTILNIGWDQAATGMAGDSGEMFAAAKGAVAAFSRSLAKSLAPHVRVNCIAPGWIRTEWGENTSEAWRNRAEAESLAGRWGSPEDVAQVAVFLVSDAAAFVNGQVIDVNGGRADFSKT